MTDTLNRRRPDIEPAQDASEAALRSLSADKEGKSFNFREGDSPLFQLVVSDVRANLKRLLVPQKADFNRAIKSHNVELFIDLCNRLLTHFMGVKSQLFFKPESVHDLFRRGFNMELEAYDEREVYSEFVIDAQSRSTLKIGLKNGALTVGLVARYGLNEKFPGISDRYITWRVQQSVEICSM
ncbi:hypothetical protein HZC21_00235 [Candidatus Peregrinibacteria bacterium]|nr:hypothetical protein [Candidatus Peregrinibacteria bacterium]